MRACLLLAVLVAACDDPAAGTAPDAGTTADGALAQPDAADPMVGFGTLSGMCGVLAAPELTGAAPLLVHDAMTFMRAYVDPADRPLLTDGGATLAATPNAGGSSGLSEVFAFEQLARCELASLVKTETEIIYDIDGKITDILVEVDGYKIGVSVVRAIAYPFGAAYSLEAATTIMRRKLVDIQASSMNVSAADQWTKQILAVLAWDDAHAATIEQAWDTLTVEERADTIVVVTTTHGDDLFIYSNM
jgi:hypothetical protein